ncbi:MAG TPA: bifunctional 3-deoxy-7-phosphoheptulonate synthase/chorismate mutase [Myxococcota bacterium]|nr:bifunctional 3-deoxy-7-phosphoheptulonate synthase/chorismate mutase [Myxococcota bacterium]HRY93232.1 bifunctional 3-deoxy-7-phosphoheptulonate synthase/chorismate mutase [Myxococcota bacterium]HSA21039.1 bifunctional 3-deoxy-7-phosphoheptulonate synthase/chorismate mutase [Myxococcota bacterium]
MPEKNLTELRDELEHINASLLELLSRRARVVTEVQRLKAQKNMPTFDPEREMKMLQELVARNPGPFPDETVRRLFKEIFRACVELMQRQKERALLVSRASRAEDLVVRVRGRELGAAPFVIAGPCAVESEEQLEAVAQQAKALGCQLLRGGAFKPRTSPYAFQGLGAPGLELLRRVARRHDMVTVSEVMDTRQVALLAEYVDVLQVGSRNMYNYPLLRELGKARRPVLLKRGLSATLEEFLWAAEYVASEGNDQLILCERGIRTFETETRNTLDLSAVALLRQKSYLPVVVDVSHAAGRKDILAALGRAALAAGASGLMVEVHPCPAVARSDSQQQLDLEEFAEFMASVGLARRLHAAAGAND